MYMWQIFLVETILYIRTGGVGAVALLNTAVLLIILVNSCDFRIIACKKGC